jgi:HAD superfamily hydrolase (TIGR01459 family)
MTVMPLASARVTKRAGPLLAAYDVVFCDVWGVIHNGKTAYTAACGALQRFRESGGTVILVSNAPTPQDTVMRLLDEKGVPRAAWDGLVTSGDITRSHLRERGDRSVHHIGPARDLSLFEALDVKRVSLEQASVVVVTGLVDDFKELPESYRPLLQRIQALGLPMVCANPDLVVDVGGRLYPCAGAIAAIYEELGGSVYWAGKPYPVAYTTAAEMARRLRGEKVARARILAIGDAVRTDLEGARQFGIDSLFVAGGVHRAQLMPVGYLEPKRLEKLLAAPAPWPVAVMEELAW